MTYDEIEASAELLRAVRGKKYVHYLPHGANPIRGLLSGFTRRFTDSEGKVPHKDAVFADLFVEVKWDTDTHETRVSVSELVTAICAGRYYIHGDFSHSS